MTNRWRRLAMLAGLFGALAGMASVGTTEASAATAVTQARHSASTASQPGVTLSAQPKVLGKVHICNQANTSLCLQGSGVGYNMTVESSSYAILTEIQVGTTVNKYPIVEFQNPNGHCVYVDGIGDVKLQNASCGAKSYEEWRVQPSPYYSGYKELQNVDYGGYMLIQAVVDGEFVYEGPDVYSAYYIDWKLVPA